MGTAAAVREMRLVRMIFLFSQRLLEKDTPDSVTVLNNDIGTKMLKKSDDIQGLLSNFRLWCPALKKAQYLSRHIVKGHDLIHGPELYSLLRHSENNR